MADLDQVEVVVKFRIIQLPQDHWTLLFQKQNFPSEYLLTIVNLKN